MLTSNQPPLKFSAFSQNYPQHCPSFHYETPPRHPGAIPTQLSFTPKIQISNCNPPRLAPVTSESIQNLNQNREEREVSQRKKIFSRNQDQKAKDGSKKCQNLKIVYYGPIKSCSKNKDRPLFSRNDQIGNPRKLHIRSSKNLNVQSILNNFKEESRYYDRKQPKDNNFCGQKKSINKKDEETTLNLSSQSNKILPEEFSTEQPESVKEEVQEKTKSKQKELIFLFIAVCLLAGFVLVMWGLQKL